MKLSVLFKLNLMFLLLFSTACQRSTQEVWEDTKTAGRYIGKGVRSLGGKQSDSKQVHSRSEFDTEEEEDAAIAAAEFVPLDEPEEPSEMQLQEKTLFRQSRYSPGDPGSTVPGIEGFADPSSQPELAKVFKNIHFPYNSSLVKGNDNLSLAQGIARYLKAHPATYLFIEGHCDERGPQAYNLSLGLRRANAVRNFLIEQGVNPDTLFVISYGKERPLSLERNDAAYALNRRAQFRVFKGR